MISDIENAVFDKNERIKVIRIKKGKDYIDVEIEGPSKKDVFDYIVNSI